MSSAVVTATILLLLALFKLTHSSINQQNIVETTHTSEYSQNDTINTWSTSIDKRQNEKVKKEKEEEEKQRIKRDGSNLPQALAQTDILHDHELNLNIPLPPPPPFPGTSFGLSPFKTSNNHQASSPKFGSAFSAFSSSSSSSSIHAKSSPLCGGVLKARHGIIQTPNFPHKFPTPLECVWIIDASELPSTGVNTNTSIIVYLTQLYVLGGLKFTEYMYYSDDYKVPAHRVFTMTEDDVTQVAWIQFNSQYLEIRFTLASLDGTHLRALDRLLDVYGFNITYEVQNSVKPYQCNTLQCRFLGHCYAKNDFR